MRIMYIIKSFAMKAGVERVMSDKMNWLVEHGYEVSMVTYEQGDHPFAFPLSDRVRHYKLDARFFKLYQYPLWQRPFRMRQMRRRFRDGLQQAVDSERPDIIITTTYSMKVLDIIVSVRTNARRLIESHVACCTVRKSYEYMEKPLLRPLASLYDRWTFARIARFEKLIVLTHGDASEWRRYIKNVEIIPNPVTSYPDMVPPHDGTCHRIIAVGRLQNQKGFDMLIDAFALIADRCPEWHVDIFGSGDDRDMLLDRIQQKGLAGRVNILSPVDNIYDEYKNSDFYVFSSRYEGFGLVLVEAMSCGVPCVSFRCKYGPEEIIHDGVDGLLAEDGNVQNLADKMLWMTVHTPERLAMGQESRKSAYKYQKDTVMRHWAKLFETIKAVK